MIKVLLQMKHPRIRIGFIMQNLAVLVMVERLRKGHDKTNVHNR